MTMLVKLHVSSNQSKILDHKVLTKIFRTELESADERDVEVMVIPYSESTSGNLVEVHAPFMSSFNQRVSIAVREAYTQAVGGKNPRFTFALSLDL